MDQINNKIYSKKIKVLWFTNTPSLYNRGNNEYNGGGWIESLERLVRDNIEIDLAISFFYPQEKNKSRKNNSTYYPIYRNTNNKNIVKKLFNNWNLISYNKKSFQKKILSVLNDFKPDVIQVFGTEGPFSIVQELTRIPVMIHLQGIINPYLDAFYPPNISFWDIIFSKDFLLQNITGSSPIFAYNLFKKQTNKEKVFLSLAKFISGRTHWDKMITKVMNPKAQYFHINEVLRPVFYEKNISLKKKKKSVVYRITSVLSPQLLKGIDLVFSSAKRFLDFYDIDFVWQIIGIKSDSKYVKFYEKINGINHKEIKISFLGVLNENELVNILVNSDVFVHPSYIDNSPNSLCEAQIIGIPTIACNVGGVSSLINHSKTGFLIPSNGVFELCYYLSSLHENKDLSEDISMQAKKVALERHNKEKIITKLINKYKKIIN